MLLIHYATFYLCLLKETKGWCHCTNTGVTGKETLVGSMLCFVIANGRLEIKK